MHNRSSNLEERMLRTFFLATATNSPFTLHSTTIKQKLKISKGKNYIREREKKKKKKKTFIPH
jgi:hypothetical protein